MTQTFGPEDIEERAQKEDPDVRRKLGLMYLEGKACFRIMKRHRGRSGSPPNRVKNMKKRAFESSADCENTICACIPDADYY
jgi:hypothetical protein